jgi:hypothetical protein
MVRSALQSVHDDAHDEWPTSAQELAATIRVEVMCDSGPAAHASVSVDSKTGETDNTGIVSLPTAIGTADITVTKERFLPAKARVTVDEPREWPRNNLAESCRGHKRGSDCLGNTDGCPHPGRADACGNA